MYSGQQHELLDWLKHITFPMEAKFADPRLAEQVYSAVVRRVIDSGVGIAHRIMSILRPYRRRRAVIMPRFT